MSQVKEEPKTKIAETTAEADISHAIPAAETVDSASVEADKVVDTEEPQAIDELETAETVAQPAIEQPERASEATETAASEEAIAEEEKGTEAVSELEEPQAAPTQAEEEPETEEPASEEAPTLEEEPEEEEEAEPTTPLSDLEAGAEMIGRVVGVADFGAFVDIEAETDGLVHISELSEGRVEKVTDVVSVGQKVDVWIKDVDVEQGRISLSMKPKPQYRLRDLKPGMVVEGTVTGIRNYGVFVDIGAETEGLVHVSEMAEGYVDKPSKLVSKGDSIEVRIKKVDRKRRRINLSMKGLTPSAPPPTPARTESTMPTAMELAMREALGELEEEGDEELDTGAGVGEASRDELSEVFTQMLREHREDEDKS